MSENLKTQKLKTLKEHLNEVGKWKNSAKLTMVKNSSGESKSVINKLKDFWTGNKHQHKDSPATIKETNENNIIMISRTIDNSFLHSASVLIQL